MNRGFIVLIIILLACYLLVGCGESDVNVTTPDPLLIKMEDKHFSVPLEKMSLPPNSDWTVTREGCFKDSSSYGGWRYIYRFRDKEGHEFVGVNGIGITEIGSHSVGRSTTTDER